jgi:hypothetical protein
LGVLEDITGFGCYDMLLGHDDLLWLESQDAPGPANTGIRDDHEPVLNDPDQTLTRPTAVVTKTAGLPRSNASNQLLPFAHWGVTHTGSFCCQPVV